MKNNINKKPLDKFKQNNKKLLEIDSYYRTAIITKAIEVEKWIEGVIMGNYVNHDQGIEEAHKFLFCFFEDANLLTFSNKREILRRVLITEKLMISKEVSKLDGDIQSVGKFRNNMAHLPFSNDFSKTFNFDGETIEYYSYSWEKEKGVTKLVKINKQIIESNISTMDSIITRLRLIEKVLAERWKDKLHKQTRNS